MKEGPRDEGVYEWITPYVQFLKIEAEDEPPKKGRGALFALLAAARTKTFLRWRWER